MYSSTTLITILFISPVSINFSTVSYFTAVIILRINEPGHISYNIASAEILVFAFCLKTRWLLGYPKSTQRRFRSACNLVGNAVSQLKYQILLTCLRCNDRTVESLNTSSALMVTPIDPNTFSSSSGQYLMHLI